VWRTVGAPGVTTDPGKLRGWRRTPALPYTRSAQKSREAVRQRAAARPHAIDLWKPGRAPCPANDRPAASALAESRHILGNPLLRAPAALADDAIPRVPQCLPIVCLSPAAATSHGTSWIAELRRPLPVPRASLPVSRFCSSYEYASAARSSLGKVVPSTTACCAIITRLLYQAHRTLDDSTQDGVFISHSAFTLCPSPSRLMILLGTGSWEIGLHFPEIGNGRRIGEVPRKPAFHDSCHADCCDLITIKCLSLNTRLF
jgi:hypothetical protein